MKKALLQEINSRKKASQRKKDPLGFSLWTLFINEFELQLHT